MPGLNSTIADIAVRKFGDTVYELTQQTESRLRGIVKFEQLKAEDMMLPRVGNVEVQKLNERHPKVIPSDITWDQRRLAAERVGVALFVDKWDRDKMLADPNSILAKRAAQALERHLDRVVCDAALATVFVGKQGTTPLSAASDGVIQVDATAGLTYAKLLEIDANFQKKEVGTQMPIRKFLLLSEQEHSALMQQGTLISGDFSRQYVVDKGQMVRALDFELIMYGSAMPIPMLNVSGGVRSCLAIAAEAITVGITQAWDIEEKEVNERWFTRQIQASGIIGGVRMEATRVQEVRTTAT